MANDFKRMQKLAGIITESKLNENKPYALLATVADDWGKDSDLYGDLEAAVVGWTDRNGELTPKGKIAIKNLLANWDLLDDYGYFIDGIPSDDDSAPSDKMNEGDTDYDRAKDAKRLGVKGEKDIYGAGVEKGEEIEKKKMKMSELKAAIKELALSEGEDDVNFNDDESLYDPVYEDLSMRDKDKIEQIIDMLNGVDGETMEYILRQVGMEDQMANQLVHNKAEMYEASEFDMNKAARIEEFIIALNRLVDEYHAELYLNDDLFAAIEMVIKAAKEEAMNSELSEAKKDEEVEDIKDVDVTVGDEETTADVTTVDVDPNVKAVQDALTQAQAAAEKLGDEKLTDQIGNTITFFTRSHIVDKPGMTAESNIKERINKLIKSL
jgi:hypothetical protein